MRVSREQLAKLLANNVVELRFYRRNPKPGWSNIRRMLVTNDTGILSTIPGRKALHFKPPTQRPLYNYKNRGLVCAWDLFWQNYRMIPTESVNITRVIPTHPVEYFWNYFNIYLQGMSAQEKLEFMNR